MPTAPQQYRPPGWKDRAKTWASRQTDYRAWYNLALWRGPGGLRQQQLTRQPLCEDCLKIVTSIEVTVATGVFDGEGVEITRREVRLVQQTTPATDVDHREAHKGDWDKFVDPDNHRSLCHPCHSRKTISEDGVNAQ